MAHQNSNNMSGITSGMDTQSPSKGIVRRNKLDTAIDGRIKSFIKMNLSLLKAIGLFALGSVLIYFLVFWGPAWLLSLTRGAPSMIEISMAIHVVVFWIALISAIVFGIVTSFIKGKELIEAHKNDAYKRSRK